MYKRTSKYYTRRYFDALGISTNPDVYRIMKIQSAPPILQLAGYTRRWKPNNILEVGCGFGFLVEAFEKQYGVKSLGIDISEFAINFGKKHYKYDNIEIGDVTKMKIKDKEFELCVCLRLLEELGDADLEEALDEMVRVTDKIIIIRFAITVDSRYEYMNNKTPEYIIKSLKDRGFDLINSENLTTDEIMVFEVRQDEDSGFSQCS